MVPQDELLIACLSQQKTKVDEEEEKISQKTANWIHHKEGLESCGPKILGDFKVQSNKQLLAIQQTYI